VNAALRPVASAIALATICSTAHAWAQPRERASAPEPAAHAAVAAAAPAAPSDPLRPTGMVLTGGGLLLAGIGGVVLATGGDGDALCGLTGCAPRADFAQRNAGAGLLGAGIGLVWVGGIAWVAGSLDRTPPRRRSSSLMTTGVVLAGVGAAASLGGVGIGLANTQGFDGATVAAVPLAVGGGVCAMIGVPAWMSGAQTPISTDEATERRSGRAAGAGIALTAIGTGALTGAAVVGATFDHADPDVARITATTLGANGVLLVGGGLLLWDHGTTPVARGDVPREANATLLPEIAFGPVSTARWRF
jgi:hypothetical protein